MRTGAVASTSGRSFSCSSSLSSQFFCPLLASTRLAAPSAPLQRRRRPHAGRPNGLVVAQAGQLPPAPVRGGAGRGAQQEASSTTAAIQPSSSTTAPSTSSSSSSPMFSLATTAAAGALLADAAAWAVSSFARERGAVSSSASAAGLRGEANGRRRRSSLRSRRRKKPADVDDGLFPGPPPRSYRAALSVTRRSVALTRAVQAADFGNIAAALTELDRALAEHAAAGGSWEERGEAEEDGGEEGGGERRRRTASLLPSGVGEEDVSLFSFRFLSFVALLSLMHCSLLNRRSFRNQETKKKLTTLENETKTKIKILNRCVASMSSTCRTRRTSSPRPRSWGRCVRCSG